MRYLYYTLTIVLTFSLGSWLSLSLSPAPPPAADALIINQRIITANEMETRRSDSPYHFEGQDAFVEDLITRELLIQEARSQKIDQEEQFRQALQDYIEQSLLKTLLERELQNLPVNLKQSDIDRFSGKLLCSFGLIIRRYPDLEAAEKGALPLQETTISNSYLELSDSLRDAVSQLVPGQTSAPIRTGSSYIRVTLAEKQLDMQAKLTDFPPDFIKEAALEERQRKAMQSWLNGLRDKARISLPDSNRKQEG